MAVAPDLQLVARELERTPYEPIRHIGRGAMGLVVEVRHAFLGTRHAAKILRAEVGEEPFVRERFEVEAKLLTRIDHPNVLRVTDLGETRTRRLFLISELLEGEDLRERLRRDGPMPADEVVDCLAQALDGLAAAHALGVVHRDIKPANVFLCAPTGDEKPLTKLLDFGIAKVLVPDGVTAPTFAPKAATKPGRLVGTPAFVAPEQVLAKPVDSRTDIYGMGGTIYFALTGRRVFTGDDIADLLRATVMDAPTPPSIHAPGPVPPALEAVVLRALAKEPADRFASAEAMAAALRASLSESATTPSPAAVVAKAGREPSPPAPVPPAPVPPPPVPPPPVPPPPVPPPRVSATSSPSRRPSVPGHGSATAPSTTQPLPTGAVEPWRGMARGDEERPPPTAPLPAAYRQQPETRPAVRDRRKSQPGTVPSPEAPRVQLRDRTAPMAELPPGLATSLGASATPPPAPRGSSPPGDAPPTREGTGAAAPLPTRLAEALGVPPTALVHVVVALAAFALAWLAFWLLGLVP